MNGICSFCGFETDVNNHHIIPKCKKRKRDGPYMLCMRAFYSRVVVSRRIKRYLQFGRINPKFRKISIIFKMEKETTINDNF